MALEALERMVERRQLDRHEPARREIENHLATAREYVAASTAKGVSERIRFLNLYDAAHAACLAGLKLAGNRLRGLMQYQGSDVDVPDSLLERLESGVAEAIDESSRRLKAAKLR